MRAPIVIVAASIVIACSADGRDAAPARGVAADAAPDRLPQPAPSPWYDEARALDLTGDGRPDTVRLEAAGASADSLRIRLTLVVGGAVRHEEEWGSSYELALVDSATRRGTAVDALVRARLDSVLQSVVARRIDSPRVRLMAEDSSALAGIEPRPTHIVSFRYGYETTVRLAWDAPRRRFVRLWSCC